MAAQGNLKARLAVDAMIYQVAKEIGALAAALDGEVDGIVLTGGVAYSASLVEQLTRKVRFIAPLYLRPGEHEIEALLAAALRVMNGEEQAKEYAGGAA
nr:hypothetical protein [Citrifermentans bremense]